MTGTLFVASLIAEANPLKALDGKLRDFLAVYRQVNQRDAGDRWRNPDPSKEADLEQLRHRHLMKEFDQYRAARGKLKVVRSEALRAGFKDCWQKGDYKTIVDLA